MTSIPALRSTQPRGSFIFRSKQKAPLPGEPFHALHAGGEAEEGGLAGGGAFVDAGVFEDLHEDSADLLLQDPLGILRRKGIAALQRLGPVGVLL